MADGARSSTFPVVVAANEKKREPVLCHEEGPCTRWKRWGLPACAGTCARREYLNGVERAR